MRNFLTIISVLGLGLTFLLSSNNRTVPTVLADDDDPAYGSILATDPNDPSLPPKTGTIIIPSGITYLIFTFGKGMGGASGWDGIAWKTNNDGTYTFKGYDNLKFGGTAAVVKAGTGCRLTTPVYYTENQRLISCNP